jgi:Putative transposase/Transposase zinc-binding domain
LIAEQAIVLKALAACRTAQLGGHVEACRACGHCRQSYNSCRNRHCPKCQGAARAAWLDERQAELLPVPYFHVVFTLPALLAPLALQNKKVVYDLLFAATAETLQEVAADPRHLGAQIGFLAVLHTWGQNLQHHPHLHCVVPGGGLAEDASAWVPCRKKFFLPIRVLSRVFRGKFLAGLRQAFADGRLPCHGRLADLNHAAAFAELISRCYRTDWVVYAKPPFGGPEQVLKYLARYTHRVAISNHRLVSLDEGKVTFRWKNYAQGGRSQLMTLSATEFIRRFLQHVLPRGFVRIRHYGFLCNRLRPTMLALCRRFLSESTPAAPAAPAGEDKPLREAARDRNPQSALCPACGRGPVGVIQRIPRPRLSQLLASHPFDST